MLNKERLLELARKAKNTNFPALYFEKGNGWVQTYIPTFGVVFSLKKIQEALDKDNFDPLFNFARKLNTAIDCLEQRQAKFNEKLNAYTKVYEQHHKVGSLLDPLQLKQDYSKAIIQLKEVSAELREMLLHPALEFLRVTHPEQAADQSNLHPAQVVFYKGGNRDLLHYLMQYAGFFNLKLPKREALQSPVVSSNQQP
ncbi:hypothetical protein [Legionella clemsonensis]|uniref:Uncharacterized protein n=1 Tax=Legionella clemsonensis TaxID=1867846 RepID=A0A222P467_9GAMM|nr:hypothetical protein [Legionella clemsonensis]ASQ46646.1 hypothetical protein clem_10500 [Legionella clemsonensis]